MSTDRRHFAFRIGLVTAIALALGVPMAVAKKPTVSDDEFPGNRFVKARLALEETALSPGQDGHLAVIFEISKGWHLYWRNSGDSGLPPKVELKADPAVVAFGDAQWPVPTRRVEPGNLVDYVFENQLVLIFPIQVSKRAPMGKKLSISANVDWLVCSDRCVPGRALLRLDCDIASSSSPSNDAGFFAKARARHPRSAGGEAPFTGGWDDSDFVLHSKGAEQLAFFPYENEQGVYPREMSIRGEVHSDALRLSYPDEVRTMKEIRGVLKITRDGRESFYEVINRGPGKGRAAKPGNK